VEKTMVLIKLILIIFCLYAFKSTSIREPDSTIRNTTGQPSYTILNINNMSHWIDSDGTSARNPNTSDAGLIFPRLKGNVVYVDGIVWGGNVSDGQIPQLRVGGSTYNTGLIPGAIIGIRTGVTEDLDNPAVRIWRVRNDWETADFYDEVRERSWNVSEQDIRAQFQTDWNAWPAWKGAPFEDVDEDGIYNPEIDIPGIPGADQTVWYVANDINRLEIYGSPPIGLEIQVAMWGYQRPEMDPFGDIVFKQVRLIYKGTGSSLINSQINDMYISQWADPDIGKYFDDYVGCDSINALGFAYNSTVSDGTFNIYNIPPPSFGYQFLNGPAIYSPGDTAIINFVPRYDYKNLSMSSFFYFSPSGADSDPQFNTYEGTLEWYNLMQGVRPQSGEPWINPLNDEATNYPLGGNPVSGEGWIDGISFSAGDRRMGITSGPFTMALGDTQEIVIALLGGICPDENEPHLKSIISMKGKAKSIKDIMKNKLAVHILTSSPVPLLKKTYLKPSYFLMDKSLTIDDLVWSMDDKPEGSSSVLHATMGDSVFLIPDTDGVYTISLTAITLQGYSASSVVEIYASDDLPPVVDFTLIPETIILGDSLLADASPTFDPEGDEMEFKWRIITPVRGQGNGNYVLGTLSDDGETYTMIPTGTGEYKVQLTVSDGIFENDTSKVFHVTPKMKNVSQVYSYLDTSWFRTNRYFLQNDKLLMAIEPLDIVRIYNLHENDISIFKDLSIQNPVRIYEIRENLLFVGTEGIHSGFWGPGFLNVYQLNKDWEITPILEDYLPGDGDIYDLFFINDYMYIRDYNNLYKVDFNSNPADPQILQQHAFDYLITCYADTARPFFYVRVQDYSNPRVEILETTSLEYISELSLPEDWRTINTYDTLMFIGFYDSLQIHSIANPLQTQLLSSITMPYAFYWVDYLNYWTRCSGRYVQNDLLAVSIGVGILYYNITDPYHPVLKGSWYGGREVFASENDGDHYITGFDVLGSAKDTYFGINKVHLDFHTGIPVSHLSEIPGKYVLYQNYPNPFNPYTDIHFYISRSRKVQLEIYNCLGQKVETLIDKDMIGGSHTIRFKSSSLASGVYFYELKVGKFRQVKKMVLLQ